MAKFASLTMVATCLIYGGSFYLASGRLSPFALFNWITHHSPDSDFSFNPLSNLQYVMRGHVRLFFGGRFNLLRDLMNPAILALAAVLCVAVVGFFYSVVRGIGDLRSFRPHINEWTKERRELLLLTGVWVLLYEVFLFFWLPQNTFYRLFYLPALVLLLGLLIPRTVAQRYRLAFFVVIIGLANFLFLIYPFSHVQKYPPLEFAYKLNSKWPAGTVIFYAAENSDESLVRYFNPGTRWQKVDTNRTGEMERSLNEIYAGGATAWLETTAIDNLTANAIGKRWFDAHVLKDSLFELRDSAYRIQFVQVFPAN